MVEGVVGTLQAAGGIGARGLQVHCFGLNPKKWRFPSTVWDWTEDLAYYRTTLSLLDVGLCPLLETEFNESKSDIKAMEYAMSGALPIVSAVEAYRVGWQNRPCLTARSSKDFLEAVRYCVQNRSPVCSSLRRGKTGRGGLPL